MEPLTLFASTVGIIGVLHILFSAEEKLGQGRYSKGNQQAKREDWYCFFQPSDLLRTTENSDSQSVQDDKKLEQRRRQQANRPRLQA
ncbi:MAG: hypothetical protein K9K37_00650 [Desulfocapsa sp.]|nr:hypothetical protein [Desulfocapsa sp.]